MDGIMPWDFSNIIALGFLIYVLIFFILATLGIVVLIKWLFEPGKFGKTEGETALEILKKRYAKGEISKEEFEEMKKVLQ